MSGADRSVVEVLDEGAWRPSYWTLAFVGTFHLLFAATLLTAIPPPLPPPALNVVDVVTFPDGTSTPVQQTADTPPVELKQTTPDQEIVVPKIEFDPRLGPKPTDRRVPDQPTPKPEAVPRQPKVAPVSEVPEVPKSIAPIPETPPDPAPLPVAKPVPVPVQKPVPLPAAPSPAVPIIPNLALPEPVTIKRAPSSPVLIQSTITPLDIGSAKLKLKQAPALKPLAELKLKDPAAPVANPSPSPSQPPAPQAAPVRTQQAAPPAAPPAAPEPKIAPQIMLRASKTLPKVQVPRITAADLRALEIPAAGEATQTEQSARPSGTNGLGAPSTTGVTSLSGTPNSGGGRSGGGVLPAASGSAAGGGSGASGGGASSGGAIDGNATTGGTAGASGGGPTGILPRRPGGASVRQAFPRGDDTTVLGRMDKTYDCSRLNRERDARCPNWDPIEGRNSLGAAAIEVPVPKGLPKLRNSIGTNPLPVCPPGTPGNQMGLSCLPTREGPGIPKP